MKKWSNERARQIVRTACREAAELARAALSNAKAWRVAMLVALALAAACVVALFSVDTVLLPAIRSDSLCAAVWAKFLSLMGRTERVTLFLLLLLAGLGFARRSRPLKRAALALVLSVALSGLVANVMHIGFGRARPFTGEDGAFHGPTLASRHNSFPSAHTCEAFTDATLVAVLWPPAAVPACVYAGAMGWARMQDNQHYPADVFAGAFIGVFCTLPLALAVRKLRARDRE